MTERSKVERGKVKEEIKANFHVRLSQLPFRSGITLIEVLISMFVLLFGLMGVAAIFPVASHYITEGDKRDRSSGLAQIAFEELKDRKILNPRDWIYADHPQDNYFNGWVLNTPNNPNNIATRNGYFYLPGYNPNNFASASPGPGHAFVIDPLGSAQFPTVLPANKWFFPYIPVPTPANPWNTALRFPTPNGAWVNINAWPVRRITLPKRNGNPAFAGSIPYVALDSKAAELAFRLRDDLIVKQPKAGDRPSFQQWSVNNNGTPNNINDDQLLGRQYTGDYSWMATVVPTRSRALEGLQPSSNIKDEFYEVTAVVFYKRDIVPSVTSGISAGSERLIAGEFLNNGELAIYDADTNVNTNPDTVDTALDKIKPTNWIAVMGVHPTTGIFLMKWYKILAMDDSNTTLVAPGLANNQPGRYLMVQGPDWPAAVNSAGVSGWQNLRVAILPGAIDAYTRVMQIEQE